VAVGLLIGTVVILAGVAGYMILSSGQVDTTVSVASAATPTLASVSAARAEAVPTVETNRGHTIPSLRTGDRWRFRYQRLPQRRSDAWRTYDHFVDRKVTSVATVNGNVLVQLQETGGPEDDEVRTFTEVYTSDGIGSVVDHDVQIFARWDSATPSGGDVSVALPAGQTVRVGSAPREYWVHPSLGKVAERSISAKHQDTYVLTLVGYDVGGQRGGDIDGQPLKCVWSGRIKWLEIGESGSVSLAGLGHRYLRATGTRGLFGSNLTITAPGLPQHQLGAGLGHLLTEKTWTTPSDGEWLAALWWDEQHTTVTVTHFRDSTVHSYQQVISSVVSEPARAIKDHSLLLLQRGNQCVVGIKGKSGRTKKTVMILVPDGKGGTAQPKIIGGDW
jgi:hypothetical protein